MRGNNSKFTAFSKLLKVISNSCETQKINGYVSSNMLSIRFFSSFDGHTRNVQGRRSSRNDYDDDDDSKFSGRNRGNFSAHQSSRNGRSGYNGGRNDYDDDDDDDSKFSGRNRGNFSAHQSSRIGRSGYNGGRNDYDDESSKFLGRKRGNFSAHQNSRSGRNDYDDESSKFSGRNRGNFSAHQSSGNRNFNYGGGRVSSGDRQRSQFGGNNVEMGRDYRNQGRRDDGSSKSNLKLSEDISKFDDDGEGENEGKKDNQPSVRELLNSGKDGEDFLEKFKLGGEKSKEESKANDVCTATTPTQEEKMEVPEGADEIFNKMKKSGLIPNAVAMLDGLCKDGLVHEAMKLFGLMREKGNMPEVVVYTAVVEGFCQAHKLDDAIRIFKKMQGNGIVPNAFSYTVLIKGLCKGTRLDEAVDFCVEMLGAGHSPNVPTFTGLVHEFCKEKGVEDARKVIGVFIQKGFFLDEKAVRVYLDKTGPTSQMVWEAIFGTNKTSQTAI